MTEIRRSWTGGLVGVALAAVVVACGSPGGGGDDSSHGTGDPANWTVTAVASHTELTVQQGASDTETVTVTRGGGYTGAVTFESNIPGVTGGVSATIDNVATLNGVTTGRVIITIGSSFPVTGTIPVLVAVFANPAGSLAAVPVEFHVTITPKLGVFVGTLAATSVGQGSATTLNINLTRTNYTAAVPMTLVTTQAGLAATFSPNPVTGTATVMTLTADASVPLGTYSVGVRANAGDPVYQATAPLSVTVTTPGSIGLSTNLPTLIVPKGTTVPTGVVIARTNYSGLVTLDVTGLPAGITANFAVNPVSGNNGSVSFTASAGMASGSYPITITGSGPGIVTASVPLTLSVGP